MPRVTRSKQAIVVVAVVITLAGCGGGIPTDPTESETDLSDDTSNVSITPNGSLEVHYINVGQSASTLIIAPNGETMLVDTGHYNDDGQHVLEYLQTHDITQIDHLVTSHNDADHIGGNAAVIEYFETRQEGIGAIHDPGIAASTQTYKQYLDAVEAHDVPLYETREGDKIKFGSVDVAVLGPPEPYLENRDRNENSIILKLTHGKTSFLLTGDAEDDQEAYIVNTYGEQLETTVLKAGHHGSSSSSSEPFLNAVTPQSVIVSSAYDSQYGHPANTVLQRFEKRSIPTFWTATHGDTVFISNGTVTSVQTQQNAPVDAGRLRDGSPILPSRTTDVSERLLLTGDGTPAVIPDVSRDADNNDENADARDKSPPEFELVNLNADAEGDDRDNLNGEYVTFENTGDQQLNIGGWKLKDSVGKTYTFPDGVILSPQEKITVLTGDGTDTDTELYWNSGVPVWNNGGDTVIVETDGGVTVLEEVYS